MLFDDVLQCAIPTYFFSFSMFFILVKIIFGVYFSVSIQEQLVCINKLCTIMFGQVYVNKE